MTTTLLNCEVALSKELGDYWVSTTTGAGSSTTIVDTALMAKADDWITDEAYDHITSVTCLDEERKISSLNNTTGTLTVLAHSGTGPGSGATYRLHRLFTASEKRRALVAAAKNIFPACFTEVWDESLVLGNWLKDGSFERWSTSGNLTDWTETTVTATQTSTSPYYKHGLISAKLSTAAGRISQGITNFDDLKRLAGKTVTFSVQGWCNTANCLRIQIYDGTTTTTSDYHVGNSAWTENNDPMEIQVKIADNPTEITFRILHDVAAGVSYVDDARVISDYRGRLYIGQLALVQNKPHQVLIEPNDYSQEEDWITISDYKVDKDGYLYIPTRYCSDYRLRIQGIGYLDFYASGVVSTAWTATIALDEPQVKILVAEAAIYLCNQMILPNYTSGTREQWKEGMAYWRAELIDRRRKYGMLAPAASVSWR